MSVSNKDRGLNKKIINVIADILSDPSSELYKDIKKGLEQLEETTDSEDENTDGNE